MFRTFDKAKLCGKPAATKAALDPFCELESKVGMEGRQQDFNVYNDDVMGTNS
jgi:hypothetical protein